MAYFHLPLNLVFALSQNVRASTLHILSILCQPYFQLEIVNNTLSGGEKAVVLADGGLVEDWIKTRRLLVVVAHSAKVHSHALFVYNTQSIPITNVEDLTINHILPIDSAFK